MLVGTLVHGDGHVRSSSLTAVVGPMGEVELPKIAIISPGATGPVRKLAAFVTSEMTGTGAVTVKDTLTMVFPPLWPVPAMTMVP
jgi:hypothetical protein